VSYLALDTRKNGWVSTSRIQLESPTVLGYRCFRPEVLEGSMKLYRSKNYPNRWYAYSNLTGWVMFPAESNGWEKRQTARGVDPIDIREVSVQLAFDTGMPASLDASADRIPATVSFSEAA
jgi:hypothetical protein